MAPDNNNKKNNKKNRNKNKNKKASGGGGTGGNNNHNNIPIPTMATATSSALTPTMSMTTEEMNDFVENYKLKDYPKSPYFAVGMNHFKADEEDLTIDAFQRGAKNDGCVGCMLFCGHLQSNRNNIHLSLPLFFEGAIRGHTGCMMQLIIIYDMTKPAFAAALISFWVKMRIELGDTSMTQWNSITEEKRKNIKKQVANTCFVCNKEDSVDKAFEKCGICKYYSYCGKDCQTYHWKEGNHMAECRHLKILQEYCKPRHVKEIRDAIISGIDPKDINRLQLLRTNLGLNRPKEEYEELLLHLGDDSNTQDRYRYLTARKDGTMHIGSTPEEI